MLLSFSRPGLFPKPLLSLSSRVSCAGQVLLVPDAKEHGNGKLEVRPCLILSLLLLVVLFLCLSPVLDSLYLEWSVSVVVLGLGFGEDTSFDCVLDVCRGNKF